MAMMVSRMIPRSTYFRKKHKILLKKPQTWEIRGSKLDPQMMEMDQGFPIHGVNIKNKLINYTATLSDPKAAADNVHS